MLLEGEVVKVGQQSIHIIVLGLSSAVIADEDIQEDFKYKIKHGKEVFVSKSHKNHRIKVGTTLRFVVKKLCIHDLSQQKKSCKYHSLLLKHLLRRYLILWWI